MYDGLDSRCGGSGWLACRCGGDQCYCDFNGAAECYGCPDCEGFFDTYEDDPCPEEDDQREEGA